MTYYVIGENSGMLLESLDYDRVTDEVVQGLADEFDEPIWLIRGEHSGLTATPGLKLRMPEPEQPGQSSDVERRAELEKLRRWQAGAGIPG